MSLPDGVHWNARSRWLVLFTTADGGRPEPGSASDSCYFYRPSRNLRALSPTLRRSRSGGQDDEGSGEESSETEWDPPPEGVCGLGLNGQVWLYDEQVQ